MKSKPNRHSGRRIRIIGGRWRGSKIPFPDNPQLRPTPDRLRETLFNWLQPHLEGAHCLDLFAGSGVLGLEALSRGAAYLDSVETDRRSVALLNEQRQRFSITEGEVYAGDFRRFFQHHQHRYHVVFLDPPYFQDYLTQACRFLDQNRLHPGALIYVETHVKEALPEPPWEMIKESRAGDVHGSLWLADKS